MIRFDMGAARQLARAALRITMGGLLAAGLAGGAQAQERTAISGTTVSLTPLKGFAPSAKFAGLENAEAKASVLVVEMPPEAHPQLSALFTDLEMAKTNFAKQNITIDDAEEIETASGKGRILTGQQALGAATFDKWIVLLKGAKTVMITVQAPDDSDLDGVEHTFADNPDIRRNFTGRVIRINRDGSIPKDNPWLTRATVLADTFAHGFKDPEGAALNPQTGELWMIDHGPQGGDEINIVRAGKDYGWPDVSYGRQYDARQSDGRKNVRVGDGATSRPDVEEPIYYWVPSIAPSGMMFYTGDMFPEWKGNLFIGAMAGQHLVRLVLKGERVVAEEQLLADQKQRVREVRQAPDGSIYILQGASIVRLTPKK